MFKIIPTILLLSSFSPILGMAPAKKGAESCAPTLQTKVYKELVGVFQRRIQRLAAHIEQPEKSTASAELIETHGRLAAGIVHDHLREAGDLVAADILLAALRDHDHSNDGFK